MKQQTLIAALVVAVAGAAAPAVAQHRMPGGISAQAKADVMNIMNRMQNGIITQADATTGPGGATGMGNRAHWYDTTTVWEDGDVSVHGEIPANVANGSVLNNTGIAEAESLPGQGVAGPKQPAVGAAQPPFYGPQLVSSPTARGPIDASAVSPAMLAQINALLSADASDSAVSADGFGGAELEPIYLNYAIVVGQNGSDVMIVPSTEILTPSSVMTSLDLEPALCGH
jgi:hypothetical protein